MGIQSLAHPRARMDGRVAGDREAPGSNTDPASRARPRSDGLSPCFREVTFTLRGTGPPVLFLHGIPTGPRLWDHVVQALSPHFTSVVPDLIDAADPSGDAYPKALEALRVKLRYVAWDIVGHDAGCVLAVHYAARFPARR